MLFSSAGVGRQLVPGAGGLQARWAGNKWGQGWVGQEQPGWAGESEGGWGQVVGVGTGRWGS